MDVSSRIYNLVHLKVGESGTVTCDFKEDFS